MYGWMVGKIRWDGRGKGGMDECCVEYRLCYFKRDYIFWKLYEDITRSDKIFGAWVGFFVLIVSSLLSDSVVVNSILRFYKKKGFIDHIYYSPEVTQGFTFLQLSATVCHIANHTYHIRSVPFRIYYTSRTWTKRVGTP